MSYFTELRRRDVIRVGAAYLVTSWLIVQVVATIAPAFDLGGSVLRVIIIVLSVGFLIPPPSAYQRERYGDPAFEKLLDRQQEIQMRERHEVLAVVCNDNPYADVWQPLDSTCGQYGDELTRTNQ